VPPPPTRKRCKSRYRLGPHLVPGDEAEQTLQLSLRDIHGKPSDEQRTDFIRVVVGGPGGIAVLLGCIGRLWYIGLGLAVGGGCIALGLGIPLRLCIDRLWCIGLGLAVCLGLGVLWCGSRLSRNRLGFGLESHEVY